MTQKKLYLCPQKLQAKLLIGWWTVGDLCITLVLLLAFFLTGYAPFFLALCLGYLFLSLRFDGKSNLLGGLKRHMLYHTTHQLFVKTAKEQNKPHKKALPIQRVIDFKLEDNYVISDGHYVYFYRYYAPNTHIMTDDEIQSEIGKLGRLFDTLKCSFSLFATDKVENLEAIKNYYLSLPVRYEYINSEIVESIERSDVESSAVQRAYYIIYRTDILSFVISAPHLSDFSSTIDAILYALSSYWLIKLTVVLAADIFIFIYKPQPLGISDVKAGHGQHGSQQFASDEEVSHVYEKVSFGSEREPGFLVGTQGKNWLVDTSDTNLLLVAPPKMGKTRRNFIPTLEYNARVNENTGGHGAGMILMDVKGTLYNKAGPELQAKGYCTPVLDLRNVFRSYQFNILYRVNKEIDAWRTAANEEDRVKHYGAAERFAKVAANAIIANVQAHGSNDNQFFIDTARGMITGFILLVALYAPPTARHIISVFELVVQCSAPESLPAPGAQQRTMIASLMEHIKSGLKSRKCW